MHVDIFRIGMGVIYSRKLRRIRICHNSDISEDSLANDGVSGVDGHIGVWDMLDTGGPERLLSYELIQQSKTEGKHLMKLLRKKLWELSVEF